MSKKLIVCAFLLSAFCSIITSASDSTGTKSGLRVAKDSSKYCNFIVKSSIQTTLNTKLRLVSSVNIFTDEITEAKPVIESGNLKSANMAKNLQEVEYEGTDCGCTLRFWSEEDFKGEYFSR